MSVITPNLIYQAFAHGGDFVNPSPTISTTDVNQVTGFPIIYSTNISAGGKAPERDEMNGIFNLYSNLLLWINTGGTFTFDSTVATAIGGYNAGTILFCGRDNQYVMSLVNNNTLNFNTSRSNIDNINWAYLNNIQISPLGTTSYGYLALPNSNTGNSNSAFGYQALFDNTTGSNNSAFGGSALLDNTTGSNNSAFGGSALLYNTTGNSNSAFGYQALLYNITGNNNSAFGFVALYSNTTGSNNSAFGYQALLYNTTGSNNSAFGYQALVYNITGTDNSAFGILSLSTNTTGNSNSAFGYQALLDNTTGSNNSAFGGSVLLYNTTGNNNSAFGGSALLSNTTGHDNTACGTSALQHNTTSSNSAFGSGALYSNITGSNNSAFGYQALFSNIDGNNNTSVGYQALNANISYVDCTGIGWNSQVTGSNQIQLGDSTTTTYVFGTVQNRSDIRDKCDIRDTSLGLDFILNLRPVDFKYNYREAYKEIVEDKDGKPVIIEHPNDGSKKRNRYHHGFIAQEVKELVDKINGDFGGYQDHKVMGGQDVLSLGYDEFIAPLVKCIQQLNGKISQLELKIEGLIK